MLFTFIASDVGTEGVSEDAGVLLTEESAEWVV